jgi:hypothetical protein
MVMDRRWQLVIDRLNEKEPPFSKGTLRIRRFVREDTMACREADAIYGLLSWHAIADHAIGYSGPPLRLPSTTSALYWLTVKGQAFCCKPGLVVFWSRGLPATSFAPVLTTAL